MGSLLAFLFISPLSGQLVLEEFVVTASRVEERAGLSPYLTEVITQGDFQDESFRTIPEAFTLTPGVSVQKTTHGQGSPFIRGFTGRCNIRTPSTALGLIDSNW